MKEGTCNGRRGQNHGSSMRASVLEAKEGKEVCKSSGGRGDPNKWFRRDGSGARAPGGRARSPASSLGPDFREVICRQ